VYEMKVKLVINEKLGRDSFLVRVLDRIWAEKHQEMTGIRIRIVNEKRGE
jgi:hypothetical protein